MPSRLQAIQLPIFAACVAALLVLLGPAPVPAAPASQRAATQALTPRLLQADETGATLALDLPTSSAAEWTATLRHLWTDCLAESAELSDCPVAYAVLAAPPDGPVSVEAAALQSADSTACAGAASLTGDAWMRGQRIVTLAIRPSAACPTPQVRLRWQGAASAASAPADPLLDTALDGVLLNPAQAPGWRVASSQGLASAAVASNALQFAAPVVYKISLSAPGLYVVTPEDLQAAGADLAALDPRSFRLSNHGAPVAIHVAGEADGRFDPGDSLRFYGEALSDGSVLDSVIIGGQLVVTNTVVSAAYSSERHYGDRNVYWLEVGGQPGPRMAAVAAAPDDTAPRPTSFREVARAEGSEWWWTWHFTSRETWFWARLTTASVLTTTYNIGLINPDPAGAPAELRSEQVALTHVPGVSPDHRTRVQLNGVLASDLTWDGPVRFRGAGDVPASALQPGTNQISYGIVRQPGTGSDTIYLDWFELHYDRLFRADNDRLAFTPSGPGPWRFVAEGFTATPQAYDLADPRAPRLLTDWGAFKMKDDTITAVFTPPVGGGPYLLVGPSGGLRPQQVERRTAATLRESSNRVDYLVVAPAALLNAAQTIADYRAAQGLKTLVVSLDTVIDEFNHGIYHPVAIKRFLAYAYATWQAPAPQYVLLLGDGHWNFRGNSPARYNGGPLLMPPNLAWVDPFQGQVDSSNQLASFVGDDILPDVALGRLTARDAADVAAALARVQAHESVAETAAWRSRLIFIADNKPDAAGDFAASMDRVIDATVPGQAFQVEKLYLDDRCGPERSPPQACPQLGQELIGTLNATGAFMLTYGGHGSIDGWAKERVLTRDTAAGLANNTAPPFVFSLDCLDGFWSFPGNESLIETLMRQPGGGAAAAFAPTGLGVATGHEQLQRGLHANIFAGGPRRVGPATMAARLALFASGASRDLVDTYTLFGDPAMALALPKAIIGEPPPPPPTPSPTPTTPVTPAEGYPVFLPLVTGRP